jgi:hypothetical protein
MMNVMADDQSPGDNPVPPKPDPRRTANPPVAKSKDAGTGPEKPTSPPDAAISPDEMNAQNDT